MVYSKCLKRPVWEDAKATAAVISTVPGRNKPKRATKPDSGNVPREPRVRPPSGSSGNASTATDPNSHHTESTLSAARGSSGDEDTLRIGSKAQISDEDSGDESTRLALDAEEDEDEVRNELFYQAAKESHGSVINLISEDVNNVMMFFWMGHYTWAIPLKVPSAALTSTLAQNWPFLKGLLNYTVVPEPLQKPPLCCQKYKSVKVFPEIRS